MPEEPLALFLTKPIWMGNGRIIISDEELTAKLATEIPDPSRVAGFLHSLLQQMPTDNGGWMELGVGGLGQKIPRRARLLVASVLGTNPQVAADFAKLSETSASPLQAASKYERLAAVARSWNNAHYSPEAIVTLVDLLGSDFESSDFEELLQKRRNFDFHPDELPERAHKLQKTLGLLSKAHPKSQVVFAFAYEQVSSILQGHSVRVSARRTSTQWATLFSDARAMSSNVEKTRSMELVESFASTVDNLIAIDPYEALTIKLDTLRRLSLGRQDGVTARCNELINETVEQIRSKFENRTLVNTPRLDDLLNNVLAARIWQSHSVRNGKVVVDEPAIKSIDALAMELGLRKFDTERERQVVERKLPRYQRLLDAQALVGDAAAELPENVLMVRVVHGELPIVELSYAPALEQLEDLLTEPLSEFAEIRSSGGRGFLQSLIVDVDLPQGITAVAKALGIDQADKALRIDETRVTELNEELHLADSIERERTVVISGTDYDLRLTVPMHPMSNDPTLFTRDGHLSVSESAHWTLGDDRRLSSADLSTHTATIGIEFVPRGEVFNAELTRRANALETVFRESSEQSGYSELDNTWQLTWKDGVGRFAVTGERVGQVAARSIQAQLDSFDAVTPAIAPRQLRQWPSLGM